MEVCGTHTYSFFRFGLRKLLHPYVNFISGPGCPVCITTDTYIKEALILAEDKKNIIVTFGDLLRVRTESGSLEEMRAKGTDIRMVYSPLDALLLAKSNKKRRIIFLSIGFETTAPLVATTIKQAQSEKINNYFILAGNRLIPPALKALCSDREIEIEGFICPGHVSAIIGMYPYREIVRRYRKGCVVCGFEPVDIVFSLYLLLLQIKNRKPRLENTYKRVVRPSGNREAQLILREVFFVDDASWRGLGMIKKSGLFLREKFSHFDARQFIKEHVEESCLLKGCRCAEVIKGKIKPYECFQFKKKCSPQNPLGPCMVSFEGACRIYFEYGEEFDKINHSFPES